MGMATFIFLSRDWDGYLHFSSEEMRDGHLHLLQKSWGMAIYTFLRRDGDGQLPFLRIDWEGHFHLPYKRYYIIISAYHLIII